MAQSGLLKDKDVENLKKVSKKVAEGINTIHFNPTSNPKLYKEMETQHFYTRSDLDKREEGKHKCIHHYPVSYSEYRNANKDEDIFKNIVLEQGEGEVVEGTAIIPDGVTSIGAGCFNDNKNVRRIAFPMKKQEKTNDLKGILKNDGLITTVRKIRDYAFRGCNINELSLPIGVHKIGSGAFPYNQISTLLLPGTLVKIDAYAFVGNNMRSVNFPEGLQKIDSGAFSQCKLLDTVTFPSTIRYIGSDAFNGTKVTKLCFPEGVSNLQIGYNDTIEEIHLPSTIEKFELGRGLDEEQRLEIYLKRGNHTQTIKEQLENQLKNAAIKIVD